jgi:hypothetical protein
MPDRPENVLSPSREQPIEQEKYTDRENETVDPRGFRRGGSDPYQKQSDHKDVEKTDP